MTLSVLSSSYVYQIISGSVKIGEWSSFEKELLTRLVVFSLCNMSIFNHSHFDFCCDYISFCSLRT